MVKHVEQSADGFEQRVRDALRREAETIEPSGDALQTIRARTAGRAQGRARVRWFAGGSAMLATAAAVTAIVLVGTGSIDLDSPAPAGPAGPAAQTRPVQVFFLDSTPERRGEPGSETFDDPGLYREIRDVAVEDDPVEAAVRELASSRPSDPDYVNPWQDVEVRDVRTAPRRVSVEVSAVPPAGPTQAAALQALAHTVQAAAESAETVQIDVRVDQQGSVTAGRLTAADPVGTYAGIWVGAPEQDATVSSPVTFSGMAATFEGNVAYEIRRGAQVVARGATITTGGMGVWSEWSFTEPLAPGDYTVVAFDEDPALGGRRDVDTKAFTVQ